MTELSCRRIVNEWCRLNATINPPAGVLYMLIWYIFLSLFSFMFHFNVRWRKKAEKSWNVEFHTRQKGERERTKMNVDILFIIYKYTNMQTIKSARFWFHYSVRTHRTLNKHSILYCTDRPRKLCVGLVLDRESQERINNDKNWILYFCLFSIAKYIGI